jgi:hypothetical protein
MGAMRTLDTYAQAVSVAALDGAVGTAPAVFRDVAAMAVDAALPASLTSEQRLFEVVDHGTHVAVTAPRQELVIVAANVPHVQALLDDLTADPGREIHIAFLDAERDAMSQISSLLRAGDQQYAAVHLLSHGRDGVIDFGNGELDRATLAQRSVRDRGLGRGLDHRR